MDEERLIEEVESHSILYDTTHPFYKDNGRKEKAWAAIAEVMDVDPDLCKAKWRTLRDGFVKSRKKASSNGLHREWKFKDIMAFLSPYILPRSSKGSLGGSCADEERSATPVSLSGMEEQAPVTPSTQTLSTAPPAEPPRSSRRDRRRRSRSPRDREQSETRRRGLHTSIEEQFLSILQESDAKPETETDECYHFALSLVPLLVKLDPNQRHWAKIEMLNTLHKLKSSAPGQAQMESSHGHTPHHLTPPMDHHLDVELSGHVTIPQDQTPSGHSPRSTTPTEKMLLP
ncbi:uncharacterized protein LOC128753917 [Synchiropus splendidus]|uniref:uncharacterized protein LOC128753917 n=1 Tax=Synchiropus splendidus TaxID=270530 RepID=UPI00237E3781|nr:uncharacterized protein LOC128753917 [Synchiropus splendidus]